MATFTIKSCGSITCRVVGPPPPGEIVVPPGSIIDFVPFGSVLLPASVSAAPPARPPAPRLTKAGLRRAAAAAGLRLAPDRRRAPRRGTAAYAIECARLDAELDAYHAEGGQPAALTPYPLPPTEKS